MKISVVVLTKNEEENIVDCLESVKWCDEKIIIDDYSTDRTVEIAERFGVKIYKRHLENDFSKQRNFGISNAIGDWILFLDADERVSKDLKEEINQNLKNTPKINGYFIKRADVLWNKELLYGELGNINLLRLAKKGAGEWRGKVHEQWKISGSIGQLNNKLYHFPHQTLKEFLSEINFYSNIRAKELLGEKVKASPFSIIVYPLGKFLLNYFIKRGFMDGIPGLILALTMSFYSFLARGKLWQLWQKKLEF